MNTTREEREKAVRNALAITKINGGQPTEETVELFQKYINGEMELDEIEKQMIERYKKTDS